MKWFLSLLLLISISACNQQSDTPKNELWVYTSMYKDTIADIEPRLAKAFPGVKFHFYQAGSEDIATKVNAEILSGNLQADVLISSDRFWYEEMAGNGALHSYKSPKAQSLEPTLKHPEGFYSTVSIPVMVLVYNQDSLKQTPMSFKDMADPKWKGQFTTGSPLSSGTNFTTMAMLQHHYGWDYFKNLKKNETIAQGGNSSVLRRIQSSERPVGWVLLENVLRFQGKDERLKVVYPKDGVVIHNNVMAITKKNGDRNLAQKFVDWMYGEEGQAAMTRSYMYSPIPSFAPPAGAPPLKEILSNSFPWSREFLEKVTKIRAELKEKYTEIMFQ